MKVFVLMYYDYDGTQIYRMFSSFEKAKEKREKLVKASAYAGYKGAIHSKMPQDNFVISEEVV